jgi:Chaperone of endosialidase
MANAVYPRFKQSLLTEADANKSLDQTGSSAPFAALVTTSGGYTYSAAHQFYSSLSNIQGTDVAITTPTVANGLFDGDDCTFTAVSGTVIGAIVIYRKNTGANTTWRLVLYEDTSVTGLPVTPNGGNIVITWNASGIFQLSDVRAKADVRRIGDLAPGIGLYDYRYKEGFDTGRLVGLLAQEVAEVMPQAVGRLGPHWGVDYGRVLGELAG